MINSELSKIFEEMAVMLEMQSVPFKPRAYERAAYSVSASDHDIKDIYETRGLKGLMTEIAGIGRGLAEKIEEYIKTGRIKEYEKLKKQTPVNISELSQVEGLGPKTIKVLWQKLKVRNLDDLERVARAGKISRLPRFGKKSEEKILVGLEFLKKSGGRALLGFALPEVRRLESQIKSFPEVDRAVVAGSIRRRQETIGDIDILVISKKPEKVMDRFVALPQVIHVYGQGRTKTMVKLKNGLDADLRVVPQNSFGSALNYFTGSKDHNVKLRQIAIKKGLKLNEYGLFRGKKQIAGYTEEDLYKALGMHYIEPEMRENTGEIELSQKKRPPKLIRYGDLKGDLQIQTTWTDGADSIEAMAEQAMEDGLKYIAITDHTKSLAMTGGADEKKLMKQIKEIGKLNSKIKNQESLRRHSYGASATKFRILTGAEVNIDKNGELDINDETLSKLDVVGAAIHSHFNLSREEQTKRVIRAMENPHVDIIFHLTTRVINKRKPIEIDMDAVIVAAKRTGTVIEIDGYPERLDIKDEYIKKCVLAGVKMSIDSDAHSKHHIKFLEYGVAQARRGWAEKKDIINAWPVEKMLSFLKDGRSTKR